MKVFRASLCQSAWHARGGRRHWCYILLLSRYAGADALETMGEIYRQAAELLEGYYDAFYNETRLAGHGRDETEEMTGVAALEKDLLQKKIARPISKIIHLGCFGCRVRASQAMQAPSVPFCPPQ